MVGIENKFMDLNFLDNTVMEKNRKILKNNFFIDMDNLNELFIDLNSLEDELKENSIITSTTPKNNEIKYIDGEFTIPIRKKSLIDILSGISFDSSTEKIMIQLGKLTIELIDEYLDFNYFYNVDEFFHVCLKNYMLDNFYNNVAMYVENKNIKKYEGLKQKEAIDKYVEFLSEKNKKNFFKNIGKRIKQEGAQEYDQIDEKDIKENKNLNFNKKRKYLEENSIIWSELESVCRGREGRKIYPLISNVYIYEIENSRRNRIVYKKEIYEENGLYDERKKNKLVKAHKLESLIEQYETFTSNNIKFSDLYFFERINNIAYIYNVWSYLQKANLSEYEILELEKTLAIVAYMPDVFRNNSIVVSIINTYNNNRNSYKKIEFEEAIKNFCFDMSFFYIPLYTMVLSNLILEYCKIQKIELDNLIGFIYKDIKLEDYIIKFTNKNISSNLNPDIFTSFSIQFNSIIDMQKFDQCNFIKYIGAFDNQFSNFINKDAESKNIIKNFYLEMLHNEMEKM